MTGTATGGVERAMKRTSCTHRVGSRRGSRGRGRRRRAAAAATPRTITVSGTGIVMTVPDEAQFTFGVSVTGSTARAALTANARG